MKAYLPILSTSAIVVSGIALVVGFYFIKRRKIELHKRSMLTATFFAALFLVLYATRFVLLGAKPFAGEGIARLVYFAVLVPHTLLAMAVGPLALVTLRRALRKEYRRHKRLARVTFPLWLFVSISGWIIFMMLYVLF